MAVQDPVAEIVRHDTGRAPDLLVMRYAKMATGPFAFLRGACHLFYDALPDDRLFSEPPLAWACGDLHFENFGSYKGDDRLVYFDINDFDEAVLAPCTWDLVRLLTSMLCATDALKESETAVVDACRSLISAYREALARGKPQWVDRDNVDGPVADLLAGLKRRKRADLLDQYTRRHDHHRRFRTDGGRVLPAGDAQRRMVEDFMRAFAGTRPNPGFYKVLDVARRVAGTGSLGVERYVVLVEGKGTSDGSYLIDIKEARPSSLGPALNRFKIGQPEASDEAERVVAAQRRTQAVDHAFLQPVELNGKPFVLRGLQPEEDRLGVDAVVRHARSFGQVAGLMGRILAWDQLRASGRAGAASADQLADFAGRGDWAETVLEAAQGMHDTTRRQWRAFRKAYEAGRFKNVP